VARDSVAVRDKADAARIGEDRTDPASTAALAERLRLTLVRLGRRVRRDDPPGLSITLYSALAVVAESGELAIGELADAERVPSSAATRIADKLEEAGWVTRRPNPQDRRGVNLAVTAAGQRLVEDRRKRGNAWLATRLAGLTPAQQQTLADALDVLDTMASDGASVAGPELVGGRR
jgi:DNA-binding MarR family transcriptional regulator